MAEYYKYVPGINGGKYEAVSGGDNAKAMNDDRANQILQQVMGYAGDMPEYQSMVDPATGKISSQYALTGGPDVNFKNNEALDFMKKYATAQGPSAWALLQKQLVEQQRQAAMDAAATQGNAARGKAYSDLAVRGGLSKGSRERIATKGAVSDVMARQAVNRDANMADLNVGSEDEKNKLAMLNSWGGLNEQSLGRAQNLDLTNRDYNTGIEKFNLSTLLDDKKAKDAFNMQKWQEGMKAVGSYQTSRAQEESGKK